MRESTPEARLRLCDACCDKAGILKEMVKTGGCTCDVCGFSCKCCGADAESQAKQYVNDIAVRNIPDMAWPVLQERNRRSLEPLDWQRLFAESRSGGGAPVGQGRPGSEKDGPTSGG